MFPGKVIHTLGWPLGHTAVAARGADPSCITWRHNQIAVGLIVDLSYSNPHLSPYDEFQRFKHHPLIAGFLDGGTRVSYGARAVIKGGIQALPKTTFPGGMLIGDDAGFLNQLKVKGSHTAMKSGMIAAEAVFAALSQEPASGGGRRLRRAVSRLRGFTRNSSPPAMWDPRCIGSGRLPVRPTRGSTRPSPAAACPSPCTEDTPDHARLRPAAAARTIEYPKPDGVLSFDKLSSVFLSNTNHEEDQPCHLTLADPDIPIRDNLPMYDEPAQRYCPAGVYEVIEQDGEPRFQINAQNCVHCKTCDIKDPAQNINWVVPKAPAGPNYPNM